MESRATSFAATAERIGGEFGVVSGNCGVTTLKNARNLRVADGHKRERIDLGITTILMAFREDIRKGVAANFGGHHASELTSIPSIPSVCHACCDLSTSIRTA